VFSSAATGSVDAAKDTINVSDSADFIPSNLPGVLSVNAKNARRTAHMPPFQLSAGAISRQIA